MYVCIIMSQSNINPPKGLSHKVMMSTHAVICAKCLIQYQAYIMCSKTFGAGHASGAPKH